MRSDDQKIDLNFREGDDVAIRSHAPSAKLNNTPYTRGEILKINGKFADVRISKKTIHNVPLKDLKFSCHNHGAPFEKFILNEQKSYDEGYNSGYGIGLRGQFYQAGGPFCADDAVHSRSSNRCRHQKEEARLSNRANSIWLDGWKDGQAAAKKKKKVDWHGPLVFAGPDAPEGVPEYDGRDAKDGIRIVHDGKVLKVDAYGANQTGDNPYGWYVTNAKGHRYREGYLLVSSKDSRVFFEDLADVSVAWRSSSTPGRFILAVEQTRERKGQAWRTVKADGPVEPLPKPEEPAHVPVTSFQTVRYRNGKPVPTGAPQKGDDLITSTFVDGKLTDVQHEEI